MINPVELETLAIALYESYVRHHKVPKAPAWADVENKGSWRKRALAEAKGCRDWLLLLAKSDREEAAKAVMCV